MLRRGSVCLSGEVSPNRHVMKRYKNIAHPTMASFETGELGVTSIRLTWQCEACHAALAIASQVLFFSEEVEA